MSILINGMEMPKLGYREIRIYPDGRVIEKDECEIDEVIAMAKQVQSHERLISADALCNKLEKAGKIKPYLEGALNVAISFALTAPTIIPAEIISENEIKIIDTKGKSNYDPKRRFVISATNKE